MISSPKIGQRVEVRYGPKYRDFMPLHGKVGIVRISSKGKPRNHGVEVDGALYAIPCGNLFEARYD